MGRPLPGMQAAQPTRFGHGAELSNGTMYPGETFARWRGRFPHAYSEPAECASAIHFWRQPPGRLGWFHPLRGESEFNRLPDRFSVGRNGVLVKYSFPRQRKRTTSIAVPVLYIRARIGVGAVGYRRVMTERMQDQD